MLYKSRIKYKLIISQSETVIPLFLVSYHVLSHLLGVLFPLSVGIDLLLNIVLIEVRLLHYPFDYQLLQILGKAEKFLLVD